MLQFLVEVIKVGAGVGIGGDGDHQTPVVGQGGEGHGHVSGRLEATCAFEIDQIDEFYQSGWSVLAVGGLHLLTEEEFGRLQFGKIPKPWAAGPRGMFVRLPCVQLTGRRVIPDGR